MGVSRTPIREAIRKLELEGLVIMIPRKGAYVADLSLKDITDVLELRAALESLACGLAALRITEEEIDVRLAELGLQLSKDYSNKKLYVLSLLRGSFIYAADLVRQISVPTKIGFMTTSSYGHNEQSSGSVKVVNDIPDNIEGYDVLIVDDIVDTGITMEFVVNHVKSLGAKSVKTCVLLDKPERRKVDIKPDYCCFQIPDVFVVGYGLNYGDYYRNIPYVFNWEDK
jgi:hypoxanthine phosphoribosyltransferase